MALKVLDKFEIDLVLLIFKCQLWMVMKLLKGLRNKIDSKIYHCYFLTAKTDSGSLIKGFELGAKDYIRKPLILKS